MTLHWRITIALALVTWSVTALADETENPADGVVDPSVSKSSKQSVKDTDTLPTATRSSKEDVPNKPRPEPAVAPGDESERVERGVTSAQETDTPLMAIYPSLTAYERRHVDRVLREKQLRVHDAPQGRSISEIVVHRFPILVDFESLPTFPNAVHVLTKERVVRREILQKPGELYDRALCAETARNLRRLGIFNLAVCLPYYADEDGRVGLLVVTRDLWSLRLESNFQATGGSSGGRIDRLYMQLNERNLFGTGKSALMNFRLQPLSFSTGVSAFDNRVGGGEFALSGSASTFFRREDSSYEGFSVSAGLSKPFYRLSQPYSYGVSVGGSRRILRLTQRDQPLFWDDPETEAVDPRPAEWLQKSLSASLSASTQRGQAIKTYAGVGLGASLVRAEPAERTGLEDAPEEVRRRFIEAVVPDAQNRVFPSFWTSFFENRFQAFRNLRGYALTEEVSIGWSGGARLSTPLKVLGSTFNELIPGMRVGWRGVLGRSGLVEGSGGYGLRARLLGEDTVWNNHVFLFRGRTASPLTPVGRFIIRGDWLLRVDHTLRVPISLGGDNGLRGYPSQRFFSYSGNRYRGNLEFRSLPVNFTMAYIGGVLFYDLGGIYQSDDDTGLRQSAGIGLRMVFPQVSRSGYRLDFGVPTDGTGFMLTVSVETGQAIPMTPVEDAQYGDPFGAGGLSNQP